MKSKKHFIHYLTREVKGRFSKVPDDLFFEEEQLLTDGFERPLYHITRRKSGPSAQINAGDTIWLFSALKSPWGTLPPSLDAKFVVERVKLLEDGRTKFYAGSGSSWFPLCDATSLLKNLNTVDQKGKVQQLWTLPEKPIGIFLQSIRKLQDAESLKNWSNNLLQAEFDFVSYRIKDGTKMAYQKVNSLIAEGRVVFWDRFSLPRRLAERRESLDSEMLSNHLFQKIESAAIVWGIESELYFEEGCYGMKEALFAKGLSKYKKTDV